jgi:hypothetical protein
MSRSRNERGDIGTVVAILVGIVAILVVGGLAWQAKQTNTGKTTATATPTVAPTGTPVADHTATQALAKVQEFYAAYLKNPVETVAKPYVADDYLAQLYSQRTDAQAGAWTFDFTLEPSQPLRPNGEWRSRASSSNAPAGVALVEAWLWVGWYTDSDAADPDRIESVSAFEVWTS